MLKDYFNTDIVSKMTFKEFEATYRGSQVLVRLKLDLKDAFKQLGGKLYQAKSKVKKSED